MGVICVQAPIATERKKSEDLKRIIDAEGIDFKIATATTSKKELVDAIVEYEVAAAQIREKDLHSEWQATVSKFCETSVASRDEADAIDKALAFDQERGECEESGARTSYRPLQVSSCHLLKLAAYATFHVFHSPELRDVNISKVYNKGKSNVMYIRPTDISASDGICLVMRGLVTMSHFNASFHRAGYTAGSQTLPNDKFTTTISIDKAGLVPAWDLRIDWKGEHTMVRREKQIEIEVPGYEVALRLTVQTFELRTDIFEEAKKPDAFIELTRKPFDNELATREERKRVIKRRHSETRPDGSDGGDDGANYDIPAHLLKKRARRLLM